MPLVEVVAGALCTPVGRVLLTRRARGTNQAGLWEFPGGKREAGESLRDALDRELREELGIRLRLVTELDAHEHRYPSLRVLLRVFRVEQWDGVPTGCEGQTLRWVGINALKVWPLPAADRPAANQLACRISAPGTGACP